MAYITSRRTGTWELRESRTTPAGPRSRTLATFRTLTPEVLERARTRASTPLDTDAVHRAALRAGAPVAIPAADRAAGELLAELSAGRKPRAALRRLLADALGNESEAATSDSARAAAGWVAASPRERGATLHDLLLLADRLPSRRAPERPRFPRIASRPA